MLHSRHSIRSSMLRGAFALLLGLTLLGATLFVGACAEEREPIDRVQPNALAKSTFSGRWYYQRTVTDVPASNGFTFVGNTDHGGLQIVTFDIQENILFIRRDIELIAGADVKAKKGDAYQGEVIGAFNILSHFDIRHAYNPTTGEELNVLEENSVDRPWFERDYIRVDWSNNQVHNYQLDFERESIESVPYYVQETNPDGTPNPDAPLFEKDGSYFDVTSRIFAKAGTIDYPGYGEIPVCWLMGEAGITECGAGQYSIRHSFLKMDPDHQYETKTYKGAETDMFGFFWSERYAYDGKLGIKEQGKQRNLSRHNIWQRYKDDAGEIIPHAERTPRPIVYHVNTDMPDDVKHIVKKVGEQWNKVFKDVIGAVGNPYTGDMFIACLNNPVLATDPPECGGEGTSPRLGDIRYSFMAYVPKYMKYGLLGLGPSNNDPITGEIISGMAYLYHHNNTAAWNTVEQLELLNGTRDPNTFITGLDLTDWVDTVNSGKGRFEQRSLEEAETMVDRVAHNHYNKYWEGRREQIQPEQEQFQLEHGFPAFLETLKDDAYKLGHLSGAAINAEARLASVKGTAVEKLLAHPEMKMAGGFAPDAPVSDDMLDAISPARGGFMAKVGERERIRLDVAASRNMYLPEMLDDALMGLAKEVKGKSSDEIYDIVRDSVYTAVFAHEVGHSLGLMHNFGGSDDVVNYFDDYWKLRDDGNVGPRTSDPITDKEIDGQIYNYAYSSIMDYAGRLTIDGLGVGKYDRAAVLWGYGNKVEVFKDGGTKGWLWPSWFSGRGEILQFLGSGPLAIHYTEMYKSIGAKMYEADNRMLVDASTLSGNLGSAKIDGTDYWRVPYIYCSHGRSDLGDSCLTRDFGADSMERMQHFLEEWDTWYITRSFPRGNIGWNNYSYANRWYGRLYNRIKKWHDIYGLYAALLPRYYPASTVKFFLQNAELGFGAYTWAVQNAFQYLVETVLMPDVGSYMSTPRPDGTNLMTAVGQGASLGVDQVRFYSTNWSFGGNGGRECGFFWGECLSRIGFYIDKVLAMYALSDSDTYFVARASPIDIRDWHVSYYSTFAESLRRINAAMQSGDWSRVGPYLDNGKVRFPNYSGPLNDKHSSPVDPAADFTVQLYFSLLGQANFMSNYDRDFIDEAQIWIDGTWKAPDLPPGGKVTFSDPWNGMRYGALATDTGAGAAMINHANKLMSRSDHCDFGPGPDGDGATTPTTADDCVGGLKASEKIQAAAALKKYVQLLKSVADMSFAMQYGHPLSP